jgi:hypothetical protein
MSAPFALMGSAGIVQHMFREKVLHLRSQTRWQLLLLAVVLASVASVLSVASVHRHKTQPALVFDTTSVNNRKAANKPAESATPADTTSTADQSTAATNSQPAPSAGTKQSNSTGSVGPPPPSALPQPFSIAGATLYQSYACQTSEPNSTYLNIGDVYLSVTASSGGQITYWLEGTDIDNMGSLADHHTVTVPSGTWNTTLNTLNGPYSGPHQLYTAIVDISGGGTGSVRVVMQSAANTWYSPWVAVPGPANC